jgi:hypothetical protein
MDTASAAIDFVIKVDVKLTLVFSLAAVSDKAAPPARVSMNAPAPARARHDHTDHRPVARTYIARRPFVVA